jgi:hypothetical protein
MSLLDESTSSQNAQVKANTVFRHAISASKCCDFHATRLAKEFRDFALPFLDDRCTQRRCSSRLLVGMGRRLCAGRLPVNLVKRIELAHSLDKLKEDAVPDGTATARRTLRNARSSSRMRDQQSEI